MKQPQMTKQSPMIFIAEMIRALIEGRKTETRRILDPQLDSIIREVCEIDGRLAGRRGDDGSIHCEVPRKFSQGDLIWVLETWSGEHVFRNTKPSDRESFAVEGSQYFRDNIWYWADGNPDFGDWERPQPSILMPKYASRMTLRVTDYGVEPLHDITEAGAVAEGVDRAHGKLRDPHNKPAFVDYSETDCGFIGQNAARESYRTLWDSINGAGSWDANPWVSVIKFDVIKQNVCEVAG